MGLHDLHIESWEAIKLKLSNFGGDNIWENEMKKWMMLMAILALGFTQPAWSAGDQDLVKVVAKQAGVTQKQARAALDTIKEEIVTQLKAGEEVRLNGLGKFYVKHRGAHQARNPKTGKKVDVPARNYLRFKAFDSGNAKLN